MKFKLSMDCDNAAFLEDDLPEEAPSQPGPEIARILKRLAVKVDNSCDPDGDSWALMDTNGNRVGKAELIPD